MKFVTDLFIPTNYMDKLPDLRDKTFVWKQEFSSKTKLTSGQITYYAVREDILPPRGNLVLAPGLASNTQTEPLMCALTYWALTNRYNIYALDTFWGDFKPEISEVLAANNTLPEFIDLMEIGLDTITEMAVGRWTSVIGHSLGGTGVLEVFNRHVLQNKPIKYSAAILFAPFVVRDWNATTKKFIKKNQYPQLSEEDFANAPIGLVSPHDLSEHKIARYISLYPKVYDDIDKLKPRPDLIAKYNIPITFVAGGKDKKSPPEYIRGIYNDVLKYPNSKTRIRFVEFPNSKHSFMKQHTDWFSILRLLKAQRVDALKNKLRLR